jgi:hypothetical protein
MKGQVEAPINSQQRNKITTTHPLSQSQIDRYHEDGFVRIPGFFDLEEIAIIRQACEEEAKLKDAEVKFADARGNTSKIAYWTQLDNTLFGVIPRLARMVDAAEKLSGGVECYHWHSKVVKKEPHAEGYFEWHTEYGGWYYEGCLYPELLGIFIAVGDHTKENGCVQILKKSHLLGRVEHVIVGDALVADPKIMEKIEERLELVHCEMNSGDALFVHSNTLHRSQGNKTNIPRINIACHYNTASNEPVWLEGREYRRYQPIQTLPDSTIIEGNYRGAIADNTFETVEKGFKSMVQSDRG